jgi:hypothetical protein
LDEPLRCKKLRVSTRFLALAFSEVGSIVQSTDIPNWYILKRVKLDDSANLVFLLEDDSFPVVEPGMRIPELTGPFIKLPDPRANNDDDEDLDDDE